MGYIQNRYGENIAQNYAIQPDPWYGKIRSARTPQINRYRPPSAGTYQKFGAPAGGPMIDTRSPVGTFGGLVRGLQGAYKGVQDQRVEALGQAIADKANKTTTARSETKQFIKTHKATKAAEAKAEALKKGKLDTKLKGLSDPFSRPALSLTEDTPVDKHGTLGGKKLESLAPPKDMFGRPIPAEEKDAFGSMTGALKDITTTGKFFRDVASAPAERETSPFISEGFGTRVKAPTTVESTPAEEYTANWLRSGISEGSATAPAKSRNMARSNPFPKGPLQP